MDELCYTCTWFFNGWCQMHEEPVDEDEYCEEWQESLDEEPFFL